MQDTTLTHWGVKGMKWGVRRYQNKDGSLTAAGKKRYLSDKTKGIQKDIDSYSPYLKTGIKSKDGRLVLSKDDVGEIVKGLETAKALVEKKYGEKYDRVAKKVNSKIKRKTEQTLSELDRRYKGRN